IEGSEESEQDEGDRGYEHRDHEVVRPVRRAAHHLEADNRESGEPEEGRQDEEEGRRRSVRPDEEDHGGVRDEQEESEYGGQENLRGRSDQALSNSSFRGLGQGRDQG